MMKWKLWRKIRKKEIPLHLLIFVSLREDGTLPPDFVLPFYKKNRNRIRLARAMMPPKEQDVTLLYDIIRLALNEVGGDYERADKALNAYFTPKKGRTVIKIIKPLRAYIEENYNQQPEQIYRYANHLLNNAQNPECLGFALTLLQFLDIRNDEHITKKVRFLSKCEELAPLCFILMSRWPNANAELFALAKSVRGTGRELVVEHLDANTPEIRDWLLRKGWRNCALYVDLALTCALKVNLFAMLRERRLEPGDFSAAAALIARIVHNEEDIGKLGDPTEPLRALLHYAWDCAGTPDDYLALCQIRHYLRNASLSGGADLLGGYNALLSSPSSQACARRALADSCKETRIQHLRLASNMGIDCTQAVLEGLEKDFFHYAILLDIIISDGALIPRLLRLAYRRLPLVRIALTPPRFLSGRLLLRTKCFVYLVQWLRNAPGWGCTLIFCALCSRIDTCRADAIGALENWIGYEVDIGPLCRLALWVLLRREKDPAQRKRIERILDHFDIFGILY